MKRKLCFKSLLIVFALAIVCALCSFSGLGVKKALASESIEAPTAQENVVIATSGFYLEDKASVRLSGNAMKFSSFVTKEFHESLVGDVTYFATMKMAGSDKTLAVEYGAQPNFDLSDMFELNAYLNFQNASADYLQTALDAQFETASYVKVVNGDDVTYYMSANSLGVSRSMRAVALDAYLNYEEGVGYEKADILDLGYFTIANTSNSVTGTIKGSVLTFAMNEIPALDDGAEVIAYVNAAAVSVVFDAETMSFSGNVKGYVIGENANVTLFVNDSAYSTMVSVENAEISEGDNEVDFDVEDFFPDHEHQLGAWEIERLVSCAQTGLYVKRCTECGRVVQTQTVASLSHVESDWKVVKQATCKEYGEMAKTCEVCGKVIAREVLEKTSHDESDWQIDTDSNCTEFGLKVKRCTVCGDVVASETIAPKGHVEGEWETETDSTCSELGLKVKRCTVCGSVIASEPIPMKDHTEGEWETETDSTCSKEGVKVIKCTVCDQVLHTGIIATKAHTPGEWETTKDATCSVDGKKVQRCAVCTSVVNTETISATGVHIESDWLPDVENNLAIKECTECGKVMAQKPLSELNGTAISQSNITELLTATSGYYYLTEDIDLWSYTNVGSATKWNPTSTFTGTFDGNGYTIKNFGGMTGGDNKGLFYQTGTGAILRNFQFEMLYGASKAGVIGKVTGETLFEGVVVRADFLPKNESSPIVHTISAKLTIKDCLFVVGAGYDTSTNYRGYLFGGSSSNRTSPQNAVLDNVVVLNHSKEFTTVSGTYWLASKPKGTSGSTAVVGRDYFVYTAGADFIEDMEEDLVSLPASVMEGAKKVKAIVPLSNDNIGELMNVVGCGYWYLTEDVDMKIAGVTSYATAQDFKTQTISSKTAYHGAINVEIDGRGHKITNLVFKGSTALNALIGTTSGGTVRNLSISANSLGGGHSYATLFFAISRAYPGLNSGGSYVYENLSITIDAFQSRNAGILVAHNNIPTTFTMRNVFMNLINVGGESTALFAGYNTLSSSTVVMDNVFVICPTEKYYLSVEEFYPMTQDKPSIPKYKDANGNVITPGGSGTYDSTCVIKTSYEAMEQGGYLQYIQENLPTLFALDKEFFSGNNHEHEAGDWVVFTEATCEEEGKRVLKCAVCDAVMEVSAIEKEPHELGEWQKDLVNNKVYKKCSICKNIIEEGVLLTQSNITALIGATTGVYYLNEDVDMTEACAGGAWKNTATFTGTLLGNGYMLYNFTSSSEYYQGLFYKAGTGAVIKDLTFKVAQTRGRFALLGQAVGTVRVERVVVILEEIGSYNVSPFAHVIQGNILVKDSFVYIADSGTISSDGSSGYLFGGESTNQSPKVENVYVLNLNSSVRYPIGTNASAKYPVKNANNVIAVLGEDYFCYTSTTAFNSAMLNLEVNLPDSVITQMSEAGIFNNHTHSESSEWVTAVESTCTQKGILVTKCTICGITISSKEAPLKDHDSGDWEVSVPATCIATGTKVKKCTDCGVVTATDVIAIDVNNHVNFEWIVDEVANQNGISRIYKYCHDCNKTVDEHQISAPDYVNTESETFSIWAYGATPGKYIQYFVDLNGNGFNETTVNYNNAGYTYAEYLNVSANSQHKDANGRPKEVIVKYLNEYAPAGVKAWYDNVANGGNGDGQITLDDLCDRNGDGVWSWSDNGYNENCYFYLFERGDGSVEYIRRDLYKYYYYQDNGDGTRTLKRSETPVDNCIKESEAVFMFNESALDVYANANFNTLFFTFGSEISYDDFEGTYAESIFNMAHERGMKVFAAGSIFHQMSAQKTSLIDPVNGIKYTDGASVSSSTKFKSQKDINAFVIYHLRNIIKHPAFKGVTFIDEPTWECFVAMGQLAQGIKAAEEYYGREIYVMENLFPYAHTAGHWKLYNGIGLTGYEAYEYYLDTYYENVGKYLGYVQYDDYPISTSLIPYFIRSHQVTSEWAREKGIARAIAMQSYGDAGTGGKQACSPEDILWQANIGAAFGCKDFTYYTYFPIINTSEGVDNNGEEYVVDRYGNPTKTYPGVQQANAELAHKGKALMNFEYQDLHYYTNGTYKNYFFEGCTSATCRECAVVQGTLKFVEGAVVAFDGAVLITELLDEESGYYGYYVVNITEPRDLKSGNVTITFSDLFDSAQVYHGTTTTNTLLSNGQLSINLGAGDGAFIIPYNR